VATPARRLRRTLVWYSFGSACVVATLVGVVLIKGQNLSAGEILSNIGLNLIASVVFAVMFVMLSNWVQDRHLQETISEGFETIREGFTDLTDRLTESMAQSNQLFLPRASYPAVNPTVTFGEDFNRDVTMSLERSDFFAFHGPSARYVATRLRKARHRPQQIRIAMIDPGNTRAIRRRASDRATWPKFRGQQSEEVERELEEELLMNVVSLFDCRRFCPVEILYNDDTAVYRYVMFDQSVYVSWYHSPQSAEMELPESYQFGKESFVYSTLRMDLMRKFEMSQSKVVFDASQNDSFLITHLKEMADRTISPEDLERWRAQQQADSAAFASYLDNLYRDLNRPVR